MMSNFSRPTRLEYTATIPLVCLEMRSVRCPGVTVLKTNACGNVTCFEFSPTCLATLCIAVRGTCLQCGSQLVRFPALEVKNKTHLACTPKFHGGVPG